jgi:hypothetical protein
MARPRPRRASPSHLQEDGRQQRPLRRRMSPPAARTQASPCFLADADSRTSESVHLSRPRVPPFARAAFTGVVACGPGVATWARGPSARTAPSVPIVGEKPRGMFSRLLGLPSARPAT